jgi:hypothetical protein
MFSAVIEKFEDTTENRELTQVLRKGTQFNFEKKKRWDTLSDINIYIYHMDNVLTLHHLSGL